MEVDDRSGTRVCEQGFGLVDLVVAVAILSGILLVASSSFGARAPSVHPAALALQAALVEARSIATMQQADGTDDGLPTGATVSIDVDPGDASRSIVAVYRSRPIASPNRPLQGQTPITLSLPLDVGFPRQVVPALFTLNQSGQAPYTKGKFTIMISSSGYTSIQTDYAYAPGSAIIPPPDPLCYDDGGASIAVSSANQMETHPFVCRNASYDASVSL